MLFSKVPKHDFLVADAHTLVVAAVIQRDAAVESGDFLIDLFFLLIAFSFYEQGHDTIIVPCPCP